jgi:hypothetical protein
MTSDDTHDPTADDLRRLMALAPEPDRAERVRVTCRTMLRRQRRDSRAAVIAEFASRVIAPVVVGAFCVLYVAVLVATTLRLEGVFQ